MIAVIVKQFQTYNVHVNDVFVPEGSTAVFECEVNPYYVRKYIQIKGWTGNGDYIKPGTLFYFLSDG